MPKPNFFIIGAPKCGTTSLAAWLAAHPRIFFPAIKEPHFFNTDDRRHITTDAGYKELFSGSADSDEAIGEASVWYLYSSKAVHNILSYQPNARFIVMLRNPVDMAPALHAEMVLSGHENVYDFEVAWKLQAARRERRDLPPFSWAHRRLLYGDACCLGTQLERLLAIAPPGNVFPLLLDDIVTDPRREYLRTLRFLGVADDGRREFQIYNSARRSTFPGLTRAVFVMQQIKRQLGFRGGLGLTTAVAKLNERPSPRPQLPAVTEDLLRDYFRGDIERLGILLGKDLGAWLRPASERAPVAPGGANG